MKQVGYLLETDSGVTGEPGIYYDYILGAGGLYIRAENRLLRATANIAPVDVRGLRTVEEKVELVHGLIPWHLYELCFSIILANKWEERYIAIIWNGAYRINYPPQGGNDGGVKYMVVPDAVLDIHSHGSMSAFFSSQDDRDEQGLMLSLVFGKLDTDKPEYRLRLCAYGYFKEIRFEEVFECTASETSSPTGEPATHGQPSSWDAAGRGAMLQRGLQGSFLNRLKSFLSTWTV